MSIGVLMWMEEIIVGSVALVTLGVFLARVRSSTTTSPEQSIGGRFASLLATAGIVLFWWPRWSSRFGSFAEGPDWQYAVPVALSTIAVLVFVLTDLRRTPVRSLGDIDLTPRSLWSFGSRSWFIGWWTLNVLVVCTVLIAGSASTPDEAGAYKMLEIKLGSGTAGTWFSAGRSVSLSSSCSAC